MKKISVVIGIGVVALLLVSFVGRDACEKSRDHHEKLNAIHELQRPFLQRLETVGNAEVLRVEDIVVIGSEEEISLGFDTAYYLPDDFNAYEGMELNLADIHLEDVEEEIDLGFDTSKYLPIGFNAYEGMQTESNAIVQEQDVNDLEVIETEVEIDLGFDTQKYLPKGFDPYAK
jgi:hypothetical protein